VRKDTSISWNTDPYVNPLTISKALKYTSPSLFVDDRKNQQTMAILNNNWLYFSVPSSAPSSTAFIEYSGLRRSLLRASNLAWIYKYVFVWQNNRWESFSDITQVWFEAGKTYAVYGFVSGATLNVLIPGNDFQEDRAKIDMIRTLGSKLNPDFTSVLPENITSWEDANFVYYKMPFVYNDGSANRTGYARQATQKSLPLIRWQSYDDPITMQSVAWQRIDINVLY
jgi:hypothetical protein